VLLTGAILTETIFSWPGIGKWMVDSISRRDYPSVQGGLLLIASVIMIVNLPSICSTASSTRASEYGVAMTHIEAQKTETGHANRPRQRRAMRKAMLKEFWYYFSQNRAR
jgi:hypothetical protein